jgi:DNA-binding CsgD family transcriptional regulator
MRGAAQLGPRQIQILELYARGGNSRSISEALYISNETVRTHATAIRATLGAKTMAQATAIWASRRTEALLRQLAPSPSGVVVALAQHHQLIGARECSICGIIIDRQTEGTSV